MPLATSGQIKLSDIRTEFGGGSGQISFGDFYRGGSKVRAKAGNNNATNDAASVPTSGALDMSDFHGTAASFTKTFSSGATNQDASTIFGDDYGVDYAKNIVINSGVELGATSTGNEALHIDSGGSGTITVTNNGTITGRGGAAGSAGGDAFEADVACTVVNNGTMRAGGGGGGAGGAGGTGGTGGQGVTSTTTTTYGSWQARGTSGVGYYYQHFPGWPTQTNSGYQVRNASGSGNNQTGVDGYRGSPSAPRPRIFSYTGSGSVGGTNGPHSNIASVQGYSRRDGDPDTGYLNYQRRTEQQVTQNTYHPGGSGGAGGSGGSGGGGQGYQQSAGSGGSGSAGSSGSAGGTNAGAGGTGGTGGAGGNGGGYGAAGSNGSSGNTGSTGANGNYSNGSSGSGGSGGGSGGAAGNYIRGLSNVTFTNNGTVQGGTA